MCRNIDKKRRNNDNNHPSGRVTLVKEHGERKTNKPQSVIYSPKGLSGNLPDIYPTTIKQTVNVPSTTTKIFQGSVIDLKGFMTDRLSDVWWGYSLPPARWRSLVHGGVCSSAVVYGSLSTVGSIAISRSWSIDVGPLGISRQAMTGIAGRTQL